ncbi:MAG TPA: peptidase [Gammaproteobacteria bacterium]|nr:peptidase [Gammaproteobacteria bacterium]
MLFMKQTAFPIFYSRIYLLLCLLVSTSVDAETATLLKQWLGSNPQQLAELNEPAVQNFYQQRQYRLLWSQDEQRLDRAYDLLHAILDAGEEGLTPSDYLPGPIRQFWNAAEPEDIVRLELLLTAAFVRYSKDLYSGRYDPAELDADWHISNAPPDMGQLLHRAAEQDSITRLLASLPPPHRGYRLLKKELLHLQSIRQQGGWPKIEAGPVLETGMQQSRVRLLRTRLAESGDLEECNVCNIDIFDHELEKAVKRYQTRHGLKADGRVGWQTRRALNTPVEDRIRQLRINMERWRWMPRQLHKRYLLVNMTGFELYIMEDDSVVLSMPVIIGKAYRATPSFSGWVSTMEYNPYWIVPNTIAIEDFLPRLASDPDFLARKSIRLFRGWGENAREVDPRSVDWKNIDKEHFPYWMRQDPGPKNALGQMKFLFSNPYEIYLHGTPDKKLFERNIRAFSSGCIRVKDPVRLAAYLLNDGSQQKEEEILASIYLGGNQKITLPVAIPIYLVYRTAWAGENGQINYRPDIYGRDRLLQQRFTN